MSVQDLCLRLAQILAILTVVASIASPSAVAEPLFVDGFESGDLTQSNNGFVWHSQNSNKVAVVRDDGYVVSGGLKGGPYPERNLENSPRTAGKHSLSFYFDAGAASREKRFSLNKAYPELWMRFWVRVPTNFYKTGMNNKLWRIWIDEYSPTSTKAGSEFRNASPAGSANVYLKGGTLFNDRHHHVQFIRYPEDLGRWMQLCIRVKTNSKVDSEDGVIEQWRRWEDEEEWTLINAGYDFNIQPVGVNGSVGFTHGYLLGWANGAYAEDTEFLIDDFTLSTTSLLESATAVAPRAPRDVKAD